MTEHQVEDVHVIMPAYSFAPHNRTCTVCRQSIYRDRDGVWQHGGGRS